MRPELAPWVRASRTIALVIATPVAANVLVWTLLVQPQHAKTQAARDRHAVAEFKPRLQALIGEADAALAEWQREAFSASDPTRVVEAMRRLAGTHRVSVEDVQTDAVASQPRPAGVIPLPVSVRATGSFSKLARWLSALEAHPGLRIEQLSIAPAASGQSVASLKMTALLHEPR